MCLHGTYRLYNIRSDAPHFFNAFGSIVSDPFMFFIITAQQVGILFAGKRGAVVQFDKAPLDKHVVF